MPPLDPTILALLSIFGGVLLTIIAGGIGALIQHRREHSKWLRDQRLRVYTEHMAATADYLRAAKNGDVSEVSTVSSASIRALTALQLVGPQDVYQAGSDSQAAMLRTVQAMTAEETPASLKALDKAEDVRLAAQRKFLALAQKQVGTR